MKEVAYVFSKVSWKILALPLILVLAVLLGAVKIIVGIYSFARELFSLLIGFLLVAFVIWFQGWLQIAFLLVCAGISMAVLMVGVFFEVVIENMISSLGEFILS